MNNRMNGEQMANQISDFVNMSTHSKEEFANHVTKDHRTLQQETYLMFLKCVENWANDFDSGNYDERNSYTVQSAKEIIKALQEKGLL